MSEKRYKVKVKPGYKMPNGCFVCTESSHEKTTVEFTRAMILGPFGGIETIPIEVPLCEDHAREYKLKSGRYHRLLTIGALSSIVLFCIGAYFEASKLSAIPITIGLICLAFTIGNFFTKSRCFPVRFKPKQGMLFNGYSSFVFPFESEEAAQAFEEINVEEN